MSGYYQCTTTEMQTPGTSLEDYIIDWLFFILPKNLHQSHYPSLFIFPLYFQSLDFLSTPCQFVCHHLHLFFKSVKSFVSFTYSHKFRCEICHGREAQVGFFITTTFPGFFSPYFLIVQLIYLLFLVVPVPRDICRLFWRKCYLLSWTCFILLLDNLQFLLRLCIFRSEQL